MYDGLTSGTPSVYPLRHVENVERIVLLILTEILIVRRDGLIERLDDLYL
jgi:hypothetical protein